MGGAPLRFNPPDNQLSGHTQNLNFDKNINFLFCH